MKWAGGRFLGASAVAVGAVLAVGAGPQAPAAATATWSAVADLRPDAAGAPQALLDDDGSMLTGWISAGAGLTSGVSIARRSADGTWTTPEFLQGSLTLLSRFHLAKSSSSLRSATSFTTMENPQVWVSVSDADARNWSSPVLLNEQLSYASGDITAGPYVALSSDGTDIAVVWSYADDEGSAVYYTSSGDSGVTWSEPVGLATGTSNAGVGTPSVSINADGTVLVGWFAVVEGDLVMRTKLRAAAASGVWSAVEAVVSPSVIGRPDWGRVEFSPDGARAVALFTTSARDVGVRVGSVSGQTISWGAPVLATANIADLTFPEPELDIDATATFRLGALHVSQNAQRMALTFDVMPGGRGSASRAGVVVSTDAGSTWGQPRWLTSGRSFVHNVTSSASSDARIIDVVYNVEVFDPITCEEGQEECVPGDGPPNGASDAEEGQWTTSTVDGGTTWTAPHLISAFRNQGPSASTSASGSASAIMWTQGFLTVKWVSRGVIAGLSSPPSKPRGVTVLRKANALQVSWQAPSASGSSAVTRYRVTASPGGGFCEAVAPARTCTISNLQSGRSYAISVRARNATHEGWSAATEASPVVVVGPPSVVRAVQVTRASRGSATLTWVAPATTGGTAVTEYRVTYQAAGGAVVRRVLPATQRTLTVSGLIVGRVYTFSIVANNSVATSPSVSRQFKVT